MNMTRRSLTLAGIAFAATVATTASLPARASDASDAKDLVLKAQATIDQFGRHKEFPTFSPALAKARGVLIFPQVLKAGFVLGGSGGSGVLLVRDTKTGKWIGPAFYTMGSASLGFQAGASAAEVVMIINSQKALDSLYASKVKLGGDASVAIGPKGTGTGVAAGLRLHRLLDGQGRVRRPGHRRLGDRRAQGAEFRLLRQEGDAGRNPGQAGRSQAGIGSAARGGEEGRDVARRASPAAPRARPGRGREPQPGAGSGPTSFHLPAGFSQNL